MFFLGCMSRHDIKFWTLLLWFPRNVCHFLNLLCLSFGGYEWCICWWPYLCRFIIDKEIPKVFRIIKRNEKRDHKVNDFLHTYLSMPLQKFLIPLSSWITFKFQGILFFYEFWLYNGQQTDLLKKESKAYTWPKKSSSKKQSFSKLLLIEVWWKYPTKDSMRFLNVEAKTALKFLMLKNLSTAIEP